MTTTTPTSPGHPAINEALCAALFYLSATNIPDTLALASCMAARAVRLLDNARTDTQKGEGVGHE